MSGGLLACAVCALTACNSQPPSGTMPNTAKLTAQNVSAADAAFMASLPPGRGRDLIDRSCLACHGADMITTQRLSAKAWNAEVKKMIKFGAPLRASDGPVLAAYLASALPQSKPMSSPRRIPIPR